MAKACWEALVYLEGLLTERNIEEKSTQDDVYFVDGDFVINGYLFLPRFYGTPLMKDKHRIPKLVEVRDKIEKWAAENDFEVYEYKLGEYSSSVSSISIVSEKHLLLKRTYKRPKNLGEKIKKLFHMTKNVIFAGDHYFGSEYPDLFEKFGREIHGFRTESEIFWEKFG